MLLYFKYALFAQGAQMSMLKNECVLFFLMKCFEMIYVSFV